MRIFALISFISIVELKLLKSQFGSNLFHVKVHPPPEKDRSLRGQHRIENSVYDFSLLCGDGIPLLMEDHKPRPCQPRPWLPEHKCPTGFWCHEGQSDASFYCCPNSRKFANRCHLPPAVGYGKLRMRRFYFDWKTDACHELQYSGIGGNENSFMDYEKCENVCRGAGEPPISLPSNMKVVKTSSTQEAVVEEISSTSTAGMTTTTEPEVFEFTVPKRNTVTKRKTTTIPETTITTTTTPEYTTTPVTTTTTTITATFPITTSTIEVIDPNPCSIPPDQGNAGEMAMTMWYFEQSSSTCSPFLYQGSGGNSNRFENSEECQEACGIGKPTRKSCELPPSIGNGKFNIPRYYFDTVTRKCEQFFYSGKDGNDNRFYKKSKCEKLCLKKKPKKKEHIYEYSTPSTSTPIRIVQNLIASETSTPPTTFFTTTTTSNTPYQPQTFFTDPYIFESTATPHPTLIFEPRGETLPTIAAPIPATNNIVDDVFANLMSSQQQQQQQQILTELIQTSTAMPTTSTDTPPIRFSSHERTIQPVPPVPPQHVLHVTSSTTQPPLSYTLPSPVTTIETPLVSSPAPIISPYPQLNKVPVPTYQRPGEIQPQPIWSESKQPLPGLIPGRSVEKSKFLPGSLPILVESSTVSRPVEVPQMVSEPNQVRPEPTTMLRPIEPTLLNRPGPLPLRPESSTIPKIDMAQMVSGPIQGRPESRPGPIPVRPEAEVDTSRIVAGSIQARPDPIPISTTIQGSVKSAPYEPVVPTSGPDSNEQLGQALGKAIGPTLSQGQPHFVFPGFLPIQVTAPPSPPNLFTIAPSLVQTHQNNNDSPCALPMFGDATIMCENRPEVCPMGTFCQIGQGQSICCPILDSPPCDQEIEEGFGPSSIRRWSFDPATRLCQPFQFKGFKGNQNNFQSFDDCNRACGATNICQVGIPKLSIHTHLLSCQSDADCPLAHNCLQSTPHNLCCQMIATIPEEDPAQSLVLNFIPPLCSQSIDLGFGIMSEHRWSYQNGQCHSFLFRGNGGNMNNFLTKRDCLKSCQPGTEIEQILEVDRCRQPASSGRGDSYLSRYFYSPEYHQCLHFIYSGIGGNQNNFESLAECLETCVIKGVQFSSFATTPPPPSPSPSPHQFSFHFYPKKNFCPKGDALMTIDGEPIQCDHSKAAKCPTDHVCTPVGKTAYCCPSPMNYCLQSRPPLSVCSGPDFKPAREIRFTYDPLADRCIRFSFQECRDQPPTSLNTFTSNSQCNRLCCNQGYNLVYKRRLLMAMNDSPVEE